MTKGKSVLPLSSRRDHLPKVEQASHILRIAQDMYGDPGNEKSSGQFLKVGFKSPHTHLHTKVFNALVLC